MHQTIVLLCNPTALELQITKLMTGHSLSFSGTEQNSWIPQLWEITQALKQQCISTLPPQCLTVGTVFTPDLTGPMSFKTFHFQLISPENITHNPWWSSKV